LNNSKTPYKIYHPATEVDLFVTHGQCWVNETVEENIELCDYQTITPSFIEYLPKNGTILESGCGLGRWVFYLKRKGYTITGIDLASTAVESAKKFDPSISILKDDVLNSSFSSNYFESIISLGVVEHFEEGPEAALREFSRLLKDDGLLFISVPTQNLLRISITNRLKELFWWYNKKKGVKYKFEEYRYTKKQFSNILIKENFQPLEIVPDDFLPPKNMGLYVDFPFLRNKGKKWELNFFGKIIHRIFSTFSPLLVNSGALWICKKIKR
jgi:2-polyprenyl-3-methyl-5-hydroxy-6-metoxy-1,4-benzoquinol methylase